MKKIFILAASLCCIVSTAASSGNGIYQKQLAEALERVRSGKYIQAAPMLFQLSRRNELANEQMQIKYILGLSLMELKMYQVASFQFVEVIKQGNSKYVKLAVQKLAAIADYLGDDTILNYALNKVELNDFPENQKDMLYFRLGEIKAKSGENDQAIQYFERVPPQSSFYHQSLYKKGLALAEQNKTKEAIAVFEKLLSSREKAGVLDTFRATALISLARVYYQAKDWDAAIDTYRMIPRDHELWHDGLFESSWAMLRAAKFRTALSNFQSIHSGFYDDFYMPESLLLRSIVYLYICKYDEMEKVLNQFERTYGPLRLSLGDFLNNTKNPDEFYVEMEKAQIQKSGKIPKPPLKIPYQAARYMLDEADVKRAMSYLQRLSEERKRFEGFGSPVVKSPFGGYVLKILANREKNTRIEIGEKVREHMIEIRAELKDYYEQSGFIRYEMINGRKEALKKKIANKVVEQVQVDSKFDRTYFIQNGWEYWPFQGEFWRDEIGNFFYLGKQSCE